MREKKRGFLFHVFEKGSLDSVNTVRTYILANEKSNYLLNASEKKN